MSSFQHRRAAGLDPRDVPWIGPPAAFAALCVAWLAQYGRGLAALRALLLAALRLLGGHRPRHRRDRSSAASPSRASSGSHCWASRFWASSASRVFHVGVEQGWWAGHFRLRRRQHRGHDHRGHADRGDHERAGHPLRRAGLRPSSASPWRAMTRSTPLCSPGSPLGRRAAR